MNERRPTEFRWRPNDEDMEFPNDEGPWLNGDVLGILPGRGDCFLSDPVADRGLGYGKLDVDAPEAIVEGMGPAAAVEDCALLEEGPLVTAVAAAASLEVSREVRIVGCLTEGA